MSVILLLIAFSLLIAGGFLLGFLWSVKTGQYDDDVSPAVRVLFENELNHQEVSNQPEQYKSKNPDAV
ncbi:MAG: cbb3-type cytochrome oxidase assembly protein CcoS [Bacteroidia bacterium]|nr:cbb3-type cytochrome oxidase assembly protein CcoS [Bacteroidia bacterium]